MLIIIVGGRGCSEICTIPVIDRLNYQKYQRIALETKQPNKVYEIK